MSLTPLVSVVIPSFNDSPFIRQAIESVLTQTHSATEIIVVDDGSSDDTTAVVRAFGDSVRLFEQANSGAAVARNRGIEAARGEFVAFLDADDFWHPRKIEAQLRHLTTCGDCVAVYCQKIEVPTDSNAGWEHYQWSDADLLRLNTDSDLSGWLYVPLMLDSVVHTSTIMVARETLDEVGRFDPSLRKGQDLDYWLRLSRLGKIHLLESILSAYRIHRASITHRAAPTNYHAKVIEKTVNSFGLSDPAGHALPERELARRLGTSWYEFAYQHFQSGSLAVAIDGVRRSLSYTPFEPRLWRLVARIGLTTVLPRGQQARSQ